MSWTPERVEELTNLWNAGHSASVIGKQLGVTKNAVVGKAHRLKLTARPSPIRRDGNQQAKRRAQPLDVPTPPKAKEVEASPADKAPVVKTLVEKVADKAPVAEAIKAAPVAVAKPVSPVAKTIDKEPTEAVADEAEKPVRQVSLMRRRPRASTSSQVCQWPIGDPSDPEFHFCGEPSEQGKPYCTKHCAQAYIRKSRDDKAA
ncbi:GcrA family cell cycle regulator [Rhodovibrionaceae bacterium A322]